MSKFVVLEGLDGAGKSTQIKKLLAYFETQKIRYKFIHFPRTENPNLFGELIAQFLRGDFGAIDAVHPQLVALLFALDRQDFAPTIRQWLAEGYLVLADRYVLSNIAYQCAKLKNEAEKEKLTQWILNLEYNYYQLPVADTSLYLDVPFSFIEKSLSIEREGEERAYLQGKVDIHEKDVSFQDKVLLEYKRILQKQPLIKSVVCTDTNGEMLPAEAIHNNIINQIF